MSDYLLVIIMLLIIAYAILGTFMFTEKTNRQMKNQEKEIALLAELVNATRNH